MLANFDKLCQELCRAVSNFAELCCQTLSRPHSPRTASTQIPALLAVSGASAWRNQCGELSDFCSSSCRDAVITQSASTQKLCQQSQQSPRLSGVQRRYIPQNVAQPRAQSLQLALPSVLKPSEYKCRPNSVIDQFKPKPDHA